VLTRAVLLPRRCGRTESASSREINLTPLSADDFTLGETPNGKGSLPGGAGQMQQESIMKFIRALGVQPVVRPPIRRRGCPPLVQR